VAITKRARPEHAIVVHSEDLDRLNEIIRSYLGTDLVIKVEAERRDETKREYESLQKLRDYENPKDRELISVSIHARDKEFKKSIRLRIGYRPFEWPSYHATIAVQSDVSPENTIEGVRNTLVEFFDGMKPWYSWFTTVSISKYIFYVSSSITVLWIGIVLVMTGFRWGVLKEGLGNYQLRNFLWSIILLGSLAALHAIRVRVFPFWFFAIGQGKRRFEHAEIWKIAFLVGFGINVLAGLIIGLVFAV